MPSRVHLPHQRVRLPLQKVYTSEATMRMFKPFFSAGSLVGKHERTKNKTICYPPIWSGAPFAEKFSTASTPVFRKDAGRRRTVPTVRSGIP